MTQHTVAVRNGCTLVCGNNVDLLSTLPSDYALVSDPPYGIAYQRGAGGRGKATNRTWGAIAGDAAPFDPTPLLRFETVVVFGADHYFHRLPEGGSLHAWDKRGGNMRGPDDAFADVEFLWTKARTKSRCFPYLWKGICQDGEKGRGERRWHPSQKPIALMQWVIRQFTPPDAVIFDPFMGAGSTGIAALREGRRFYGVELDPAHFETAHRRIEAEYQRLQSAPTLTV